MIFNETFKLKLANQNYPLTRDFDTYTSRDQVIFTNYPSMGNLNLFQGFTILILFPPLTSHTDLFVYYML